VEGAEGFDRGRAFAAYHRASRARRLRSIAVVVALSVAAGAAIAVISARPAPTPAVAVARASSPDAVRAVAAIPAEAPLGVVPQQEIASAAAPAPTDAAGAAPVEIPITASGYQTELDACQWVRMDLGAAAPIVGAHRGCGGSVVLDLRVGDPVLLHGQGLDGGYVVTDARDAHAGDPAAAATSGLRAAVILQTCYPGGTGRVRLLALAPAQ
jgi:hypothetical protein